METPPLFHNFRPIITLLEYHCAWGKQIQSNKLNQFNESAVGLATEQQCSISEGTTTFGVDISYYRPRMGLLWRMYLLSDFHLPHVRHGNRQFWIPAPNRPAAYGCAPQDQSLLRSHCHWLFWHQSNVAKGFSIAHFQVKPPCLAFKFLKPQIWPRRSAV